MIGGRGFVSWMVNVLVDLSIMSRMSMTADETTSFRSTVSDRSPCSPRA